MKHRLLLVFSALVTISFCTRASAELGTTARVDRREVEARLQRAKKLLGAAIDEMVLVPGGEILMGSNEGAGDEQPPHRVRLNGYLIGRSEVTQAQWLAVMANNPSSFPGCDDCPVETVSWIEVEQFLSAARAITGKALRLPTEAEWEYAAGGGTAHQKYAGTSNEADLGDYAWYGINSESRTHPICLKKPNLFGACDMSGNVWEWVSDWYDAEYYHSSPLDNPPGPAAGTERGQRGGSWGDASDYARVAERDYDRPNAHQDYLGFRLALTP